MAFLRSGLVHTYTYVIIYYNNNILETTFLNFSAIRTTKDTLAAAEPLLIDIMITP